MDFNVNSFAVFDRDWALVTSGSVESFNTMTISWGELGTVWNRPVATVYVKPIRYTHDFLEKNDYFTVSFYSDKYRRALGILGSISGRDCDKVGKTGLTPKRFGNTVTFEEAEVTLVCKKLYRQDMDVSAMPEDVAADYYETEAAHTMYIGEVIDMLK